jgi:hypothetical protein
MLDRPSVIELDSNQFDNFFSEKAKQRRAERQAGKPTLAERIKGRRAERLAQGQTQTDVPVDPLIAGELPKEFGKKPKPSDTIGVPKPAETKTTKSADATADAGTDETSPSFLKKNGLWIGLGIVALGAGYWFFIKKKK